jgi:hypothetical protein
MWHTSGQSSLATLDSSFAPCKVYAGTHIADIQSILLEGALNPCEGTGTGGFEASAGPAGVDRGRLRLGAKTPRRMIFRQRSARATTPSASKRPMRCAHRSPPVALRQPRSPISCRSPTPTGRLLETDAAVAVCTPEVTDRPTSGSDGPERKARSSRNYASRKSSNGGFWGSRHLYVLTSRRVHER